MTSTAAPTAAPDGLAGELAGMLARLGELTDAAGADTREADRQVDAGRIDAITALERIQAAAAATQAALMVRFARSQVQAQIAEGGLDPKSVGRGIGDQLALACHVSPTEGSRRLGITRTLQAELPATFALLREGRIRANVAGLVVSETRHLDPDQRRAVDAQILAAGLADCAPRRAAALARTHAYEADKQGYVGRGRTARTDRRVGLRPAPDTMSVLSGFLPVEQGAACLAALRRHADTVTTTGDPRTRDQIMADTLVERITGQAKATDVSVELSIVLPVGALVDPAPSLTNTGTPMPGSAELLGYGPIPAPLTLEIIAGTTGRRWWRRLFVAPHGGIVGGDPTRRRFDGTLARLIGYRDHDCCREPFCDAPARHIDHIIPRRAGGPASFTNGRATCARTNLVREMPGWEVNLIHDGTGDQPHTVATTTPTGHTYTGRAGPDP